jgi:hypothetical protein
MKARIQCKDKVTRKKREKGKERKTERRKCRARL